MDNIRRIRNRTIRRLRTQVLNESTADFAFTTFTEGDVDETMDRERASEIIGLVPEGNYRLQVTFIKENVGEWFIERGRNTIRDSSKRLAFVLNRDTRPGALEGIDSLYHDNAYPVAVVIYEAFRMREPDSRNLQPMRHPGNCVAKLVREFFEDSSRGGKLTDERRAAIRKWEKNTARTGGTIENIRKLETAIQRKIIVKDITGGYIYPGTHKYGGRGAPIFIYQHNGHAWRELRFPRKKEVVLYDDSPIQEVSKENGIWFMDEWGRQFMTQDGTLYRPRSEHEAIMEQCAALGEDFSEQVLSINSLDFAAARKRNGWVPTGNKDVAAACVEHGHGGLWNMEYVQTEYVSLDMKHCYPASFKGLGDCKSYYDKYGHPDGQFFRVALNGTLPSIDANGFVKLTAWELAEGLHPIIYAWYGKHLKEKKWLPIPLLRFFEDNGLIICSSDEALLCHSTFTQWLPKDNHAARIVIGKFTQGAKEGEMHMQRRLVTDKGELDFLVKKAHEEGRLVAVENLKVGRELMDWHVLCYYQDHRPQYYHLRASMLAYAHINLLSMLLRFDKEDVPRVATDSLYIKPEILQEVQEYYTNDEVAESGQWRIKDEEIKAWRQRVSYSDEYVSGCNDPTEELLPSVTDPISYKKFSYLHGAGGSGKTSRALALFPDAKVLTPTHRLERKIQRQGYDAQTYHSFFHYNGHKWVPEAVKLPAVVIWDEICTVPLELLREFYEFMKGRTQVVFIGDPHQPPPIAGEMPHEWLLSNAYSEEMNDDYRSKDHIRVLKSALRGLTDAEQHKVMRKKMRAHKYEDFLARWHPKDVVAASRRAVQAKIQKDLLKIHEKKYSHERVPVTYKPQDTRMQKRDVNVPGTGITLPNAVSYDRAWVLLEDVEQVIAHPDWRLGYCITIHSAQGLTIKDNLWLIDQRLCWSNLIYTAVSRVQYADQLRRAWGPALRYDKTSERVAKANILKKLARYKKSDEEKGLAFDLCVDDVYEKNSRCAKCNIPLLWKYDANDDQQFSVDRLDNRRGHCRGNIRLTCLECNRQRGAALL